MHFGCSEVAAHEHRTPVTACLFGTAFVCPPKRIKSCLEKKLPAAGGITERHHRATGLIERCFKINFKAKKKKKKKEHLTSHTETLFFKRENNTVSAGGLHRISLSCS